MREYSSPNRRVSFSVAAPPLTPVLPALLLPAVSAVEGAEEEEAPPHPPPPPPELVAAASSAEVAEAEVEEGVGCSAAQWCSMKAYTTYCRGRETNQC
jgi:hypothetical protein